MSNETLKTPTATGKHPGGRPPIEFNIREVEELARIGCTEEDMAAVLGVSVNTIERRKRDSEEFWGAINRDYPYQIVDSASLLIPQLSHFPIRHYYVNILFFDAQQHQRNYLSFLNHHTSTSEALVSRGWAFPAVLANVLSTLIHLVWRIRWA